MKVCNFFRYLIILLCLSVAVSCERAIIDTGIDDDTEQTDNPSDDNLDDGDNDDSDDGEDDGEDDDDTWNFGDDWVEDQDNSIHGRDLDDALSVADFIADAPDDGYTQVYVVGYIVGACTKNIKNAEFYPPFTASQAILLADHPDEKDESKVISIKLNQGKIRQMFNLVDNPNNFNRRAYFFGSKKVYLGITGMKDDIGDYGFLD